MMRISGMPAARCACGGLIIASSEAHPAVEAAVKRHNSTPEHQAWRKAREE